MASVVWTIAVGLAQSAILLAICVAVEQVAVIERYSLKSRIPGAIFQAVGVIAGGALTWILQRAWIDFGWSGLIVPLYEWLNPLPGGFVLYVATLLVITDFLIYWRHRAEHKWFWPIHAVHHSPRELHAANDIGHPLQTIPNLLLVWLPMSLIQLSGPGVPIVTALIVTLLTMYIHSPIDIHFGPLRRLLVDNRFHRIHHSLEPRHFDKNFSVGLSIWDSLFGTAYWPAKDEWPTVGVAGVESPSTVGEFLRMPGELLTPRLGLSRRHSSSTR